MINVFSVSLRITGHATAGDLSSQGESPSGARRGWSNSESEIVWPIIVPERVDSRDRRVILRNNDVHNGQLNATGKVVDDVTSDQREYRGFDDSAFPTPSSKGRVMLLSFPEPTDRCVREAMYCAVRG